MVPKPFHAIYKNNKLGTKINMFIENTNRIITQINREKKLLLPMCAFLYKRTMAEIKQTDELKIKLDVSNKIGKQTYEGENEKTLISNKRNVPDTLIQNLNIPIKKDIKKNLILTK